MPKEHHAIYGCFRFRRLMARELFGWLSPDARHSLDAITKTVRFEKGQTLLGKGDLFSVFELHSGKAAARYYNHLTKFDTYKEIQTGEVIGLVETISNSYSMMSVVCCTSCVFKKLERADLMGFLAEQPEFSLKIINELSLKLNESYKAIES